MNGGENKTPLALMEQVIMVFVFALAAALCVQVFVYARTVSVSMEERDHAITVCQSMAEAAKICMGDAVEIAARFGGCEEENMVLLAYDEQWNVTERDADNAYYQVRFIVLEDKGVWGSGEVSAMKVEENTEIFSLPIAWQQ